jgi:GWxTD domain-containing protein
VRRALGRRRRAAYAAAFLAAFLAPELARAEQDALDWTNFLLGPEYTQWLVGAIGRIASEAERAQYLALRDDAAAAAFVERFWAQTGRDRVRRVYDERAATADRRFSEAAYPGRKTDRGTIYILYGEPEETTFEDRRHVEDPPVELWRYPKTAEAGLDGERPERIYRFSKRDDLTRFFRKGSAEDPAVIRERLPPNARVPPGEPTWPPP